MIQNDRFGTFVFVSFLDRFFAYIMQGRTWTYNKKNEMFRIENLKTFFPFFHQQMLTQKENLGKKKYWLLLNFLPCCLVM